MKKYFVIIAACYLVACSDASADKTGETIRAAATSTETTPEESGGAGTVGCGQLLFFKKGTKIEATTFQADGTATRKDQTTISDVRTDGGVTIADAETIEITEGKDPGKVLHYTYRCDGKFFYVDISQLLGDLETKGAELSVSELAFPIDLKEGQELPDASVTMDMKYGSKKMQTKVTYKNRKVESKETLKTDAGSWSCLKVSCYLDVEMLGMDEKTKQVMEAMKAKQPKMKSVMWYAPDVGIVRFDMYMDDQLKNYSQVTGIH
jgi:hypothetical protein